MARGFHLPSDAENRVGHYVNVIFAATGKRLRKMPVDSGLLKQPT